ncbi:DUF2470 domain-containing protein [Microbacterium lacus]|uniref:DUF2470 domain-containing protein n=1 Tax=Microbacterium lacus TaxID=415217 RepID=UPI00384AA37B
MTRDEEHEPYEFSPEIVSAICRYMNEEQPSSCLYIATHATVDDSLVAAVLEGFDGDGAIFEIRDAETTRRIRVEWDHPIATRGEVRTQLTGLLERAIGM